MSSASSPGEGVASPTSEAKKQQVKVHTIVQKSSSSHVEGGAGANRPPISRVKPRVFGVKAQPGNNNNIPRTITSKNSFSSSSLPAGRKDSSLLPPDMVAGSRTKAEGTAVSSSSFKASQRRKLAKESGQKIAVQTQQEQDPSASRNTRHVDPMGPAPRAASPAMRAFSPPRPLVVPVLNTNSLEGTSGRPSGRAMHRLDINPLSSASSSSFKSSQTGLKNTGRKSRMTGRSKIVVESKRVGKDGSSEVTGTEPYRVVLTPSEKNDVAYTSYRESGRRGMRVVNMKLTKYPVLREVASKLGYLVDETVDSMEEGSFYLCWSDTVLPLPSLVRFNNWQRSNHFPSMYLICKKGHLAATLSKVYALEPKPFNFHPRSWIMRTQKEAFRKVMESNTATTKYFIMKPNSGCQGRGIIVTKNPLTETKDLDHYIVQEYIRNPLPLEGKKFDLRVYVLLTSIRDPSIFIFEDGLVRICTDPYEAPNEQNVKNACKHLTNYAVNKKNPNFIFNTDMARGDVGNKRNFKFFNGWLESNGHSSKLFWKRTGNVIAKTILAAQPQLANVYDSCFPIANEGYTCFEVLGFDILVDENLFPWLLEVNHTPSFATETPLDHDIKSRLLSEVWQVIDIPTADFEKNMQREQFDFTRRNLPPWAKNHPIFSKLETEMHASGSVNKHTRQVDINAMNVGPSPRTPQNGNFEVPSYVKSRRKHEDSKLHGFTRIFPSPYPEYEEEYRKVRIAAMKAWSMMPPNLNADELLANAPVMAAVPTPTANAGSRAAGRTAARSPSRQQAKVTVRSPSVSPRSPSKTTALLVPSPKAPSTDAELDEKNKSMSRPVPTEEELQWLDNLQRKLEELSEEDPTPNDAAFASPNEAR